MYLPPSQNREQLGGINEVLPAPERSLVTSEGGGTVYAIDTARVS